MAPVTRETVSYGNVGNDPEAFERFYREGAPVCRRVLGRLFRGYRGGLLSADVFDDLVEEEVHMSFAIARFQWERYDPAKASALTWVVAIGKNRVRRSLEYHLRWARRRAVLEDADGARAEDVAGPVVVRDAVAHGLRRIQGRQAQALVLAYAEGRPVREVAGLLGTTDVATQSVLQRGRESFRRVWHEMDGMDEPRTGRSN